MAERQGERAVAAHRVPEDAALGARDREGLLEPGGQLLRHVRLHPIALGPGRLGRVEVEAGALAEVPALVVAGVALRARARIARDEREAEVGGETERGAFRRQV